MLHTMLGKRVGGRPGGAGGGKTSRRDALLAALTVDPLIESAVRQWLRERSAIAFCGACIAIHTRTIGRVADLTAALTLLPRRSGSFLPGRCSCGAVGLRYHAPS